MSVMVFFHEVVKTGVRIEERNNMSCVIFFKRTSPTRTIVMKFRVKNARETCCKTLFMMLLLIKFRN